MRLISAFGLRIFRAHEFFLALLAILAIGATFSLMAGVVFANPRYYPTDECKNKFPPVDSSKLFIDQRYYFEGCDFGKQTVLFCPKPLYEKKYPCVQKCVKCHDDPWTCTEWAVEGCDTDGNFQIISEPCGLNYSGGVWTVGNWTPLDSSKWFCPNARKLAELYNPQPSGLSFNDLSIGGKSSNSILRTGEETAFMFSAYVPACLNRIPMLRLKVQLINSSGKSASTEYGLYVKHHTLDYLNEDRGVIEWFVVPDQAGFRETYVLSSVLDGYVGWAWRKQFVEATEKIVDLRGGGASDWKALGGDVPREAGRVGEIYYSTDFVGGISFEGAKSDECARKVTINRRCVLNTLSAGQLGGTRICNAQDLESYYESDGFDRELEDFVRSECSISDNVDIQNVSFSATGAQIEVLASEQQINVNTREKFGMAPQEFIGNYSGSANTDKLLEALRDKGLIRDSEIVFFIRKYLEDTFGSTGCSTYLPDYSISGAEVQSIENITGSGVIVYIKPKIKFLEDYLVQASLLTSFEYNCTQSWNWGNFSSMDHENLAECMYNWEYCMSIDKGSGMYEAASAGYGPMEATPTLENDTARILLDGELTRETQSRNVTVYKSCGINSAWVAPQTSEDYALIYACPEEAWVPRGGVSGEFLKDLQYIGKPEVSSFYPRDASEGHQYKVLKCDRAPSMDESNFVEKVPLGSFSSLGLDRDGNKILYICKPEGWVPWKGIIDGNCTDPDDPNCLPYYCEKHPTDPLCTNCIGPNDPNCTVPVCNDPSDPNCKSISVSGDFEMFSVIPIMVNTNLGQAGLKVWNVNILNKENRTINVELFIMCKEYPAAINWVEFDNGSVSCGEGCKKIDLVLPSADKFDLYRAAYTGVNLKSAGRLGSYEFQFVVREKDTGKEIYHKNAWLNIFTDAVGGESIVLLLATFFLGTLAVLKARPKH